MNPRPSLFALSRDSNFTFETALCRLLAEHVAPGDEVVFVSSGDAREASVERALCQAATWVTMPAPVRCGTAMHNAECRMQNAEWETARAVLTPYFDEDVNAAIAATRRFHKAGGVAGRILWVEASRFLPAASGSEGELKIGIANSEFPNNLVNPVKKQNPTPNRQTVKPSNRQTAEAAGLLPLLAVCLAGGIAAGATGVFAATALFSLLLFVLVLCGICASPALVWPTAILSATATSIAARRFQNSKPETRNQEPRTRN